MSSAQHSARFTREQSAVLAAAVAGGLDIASAEQAERQSLVPGADHQIILLPNWKNEIFGEHKGERGGILELPLQ